VARIRIEFGGKVLIGVILVGALLFLFVKIKAAVENRPPRESSSKTPAAEQTYGLRSEQSETAAARTETTRAHVGEFPSPSVSGHEATSTEKKPVSSSGRGIVSNMPTKVFFDFNSAKVNRNAYCIFDRIEEILRERGVRNPKIIVEGNADSIGPSWYNVVLSRERAARVADSLSKRLKIPVESIELVANGSAKPVASNRSREGRAENRRTEIRIVY
jgi:outer membrane protein OmpA-like peptidoglycan-associated protein